MTVKLIGDIVGHQVWRIVMKPSYEQFLKGVTRWSEQHEGVTIELSFHPYQPEHHMMGTWCYYLLLPEQMFQPKDFKRLVCSQKTYDWGKSYDYYKFPDLDFHCGITFYEITKVWDKHQNKYMRVIKVGCDYNHLWDNEAGYTDDYDSVLFDAKYSVRKLLDMFPNMNKRCFYCGIWDSPENFYVAKNGALVHNSQKDKLIEDRWTQWLPKED